MWFHARPCGRWRADEEVPMAAAGGGRMMRGFLTEEEKANAPKVTPELLLRILSYLKPYWLQFILVFVENKLGTVHVQIVFRFR